MPQPSLANAIIYGTVDDVKRIASSYPTLEYIDEYGYNPLVQCAIMDDIEKAKVLLALGALVDYPDLLDKTALHWTVDCNNLEFATLLLERGANASAFSSTGESVLVNPLLRKQAPMKALLLKHGADFNLAQDYILSKLLGHRFNLIKFTHIYHEKRHALLEISFEGFTPEFTLAVVIDSLQQYIRNFAAKHFRDIFPKIKTVIEALQRAQALTQLQHFNKPKEQYQAEIKKNLTGNIIVLPVCFVGHAITLVIQDDILIRCDRGEYGREHGSLIVYRVNNPQLLTTSFYQQYLFHTNPLEKVNVMLQEQLQLSVITTLPLAPQVSGNCSWANIEAAILAVLYLLFKNERAQQKTVTLTGPQDRAIEIFSHWQRWDQDRALEQCIANLEGAPPSRRATLAMTLTSILFQGCDFDDTADLVRAHKILTAIGKEEFYFIFKTYYKTFDRTHKTVVGKNLTKLLEDYGIDTTLWKFGK